MNFPSVDLVAQRETLPPTDNVTTLKNKIHKTLSALDARPASWIEFYADGVPDEQLALIVSDLTLQGWKAEIKKRFSFFCYYSGFPKPAYIRVRG